MEIGNDHATFPAEIQRKSIVNPDFHGNSIEISVGILTYDRGTSIQLLVPNTGLVHVRDQRAEVA